MSNAYNLRNNNQAGPSRPTSTISVNEVNRDLESEILEETEQDVQNRLDAQRVALEVVTLHQINTPKNTKIAYTGKQDKFSV